MKILLRVSLSVFTFFLFTLPLSAKEFLDLETIKQQGSSITAEKYPTTSLDLSPVTSPEFAYCNISIPSAPSF